MTYYNNKIEVCLFINYAIDLWFISTGIIASVSIATRLQDGRRANRGSIAGQGHHSVQTGFWSHQASYPTDIGDSSPPEQKSREIMLTTRGAICPLPHKFSRRGV
jgi:hypothetical protein